MNSIWKKTVQPEDLNTFCKNTASDNVGMEFTQIGDDFICATMPVDNRTTQPFGILHGGVSVVMAETLGSVASYLTLEDGFYSVGLEIKANHLKSTNQGIVKGTVRPVHLGRTTQVWDITIEDERAQKICVSRLTMAVLKQK